MCLTQTYKSPYARASEIQNFNILQRVEISNTQSDGIQKKY